MKTTTTAIALAAGLTASAMALESNERIGNWELYEGYSDPFDLDTAYYAGAEIEGKDIDNNDIDTIGLLFAYGCVIGKDNYQLRFAFNSYTNEPEENFTLPAVALDGKQPDRRGLLIAVDEETGWLQVKVKADRDWLRQQILDGRKVLVKWQPHEIGKWHIVFDFANSNEAIKEASRRCAINTK